MRKPAYSYAALALTLHLLGGCGKSGSSDGGGGGDASGQANIKGSITTQLGQTSGLQGSLLVLLEQLTGICRVAEIDQVGGFTLKSVNTDRPQTALLLSASAKLNAVVSIPGTKPATIRQYFKLGGNTLPKLVTQGSIMNFYSTSQLNVLDVTAKDSNGDGVPDGMDSSTAALALASGSTPEKGPSFGLAVAGPDNPADINQDGVPNWFDPDADGDGIPNAFDSDADGDVQADATSKKGLQYFNEGVEFIVSQVKVEPQTDGSNKTSLLLAAKVRSGENPIGVRVRGPQALLNGSTVEARDASNNVTPVAFDNRLLDDGASEDGEKGDGLYARRVVLASSKTPSAKQIIFVQLAYGTEKDPWFKEYPYVFPNLTLGSIAGAWDTLTKAVSITGKPFGTITSYVWQVVISDSDGSIVYTSNTSTGSTTLTTIPSDKLTAGTTYTGVIYAQSIAPVTGYPAYIIASVPFTIN